MTPNSSDLDPFGGPGSLPVAAIAGDVVRTVEPSTTLDVVAQTLLSDGIGAVGVAEAGAAIVGVVTERDLVRAIADGVDLARVTASEIAQTDLVKVTPDSTVDEVANLMLARWIRHTLVTSDPPGMVSARDLLATYAAAGDLDVE